MIPTNRTEFSEHCLRRLGKPLIQINVSNSQVDDRIDDALYKFYERNFQAVEEFFLLVDVLESDYELGAIILDDDVIGVTDVFRPATNSGTYSAEYLFQLSELQQLLGPAGGISQYYMYKSHMSLLNRFLNPENQYQFNTITKKLTIAGGLKNVDRKFGGLVVRGFKSLQGSPQDDDDSNTSIHNIWKNRWLQQYASSLIEKQWGQNLSKYQEVALVGGVRMNGDTIIQRADQDIEKLERQLVEEYELPPSFIVG